MGHSIRARPSAAVMHKCKRVMEEQEQQAEVNRVVSSE